jgi:hypothetical protein
MAFRPLAYPFFFRKKGSNKSYLETRLIRLGPIFFLFKAIGPFPEPSRSHMIEHPSASASDSNRPVRGQIRSVSHA